MWNQNYFEEYTNYASSDLIGDDFLANSECIYKHEHFQIFMLLCEKICRPEEQKRNSILIIPSIFNSPEILSIGSKSNLITELSSFANVYILNWLEIKEKNHSLNEYAIETLLAIEIVANFTNQSIHVLGHCIGGNLVIAATILNPNLSKSLTLLTTPWDFGHFKSQYYLQSFLALDKNIDSLDTVPKIYIQILFFLLQPEYFQMKLKRYSLLNSKEERELFFSIERWLMSGHNLSQGTYTQLTQSFLHKNDLFNLNWKIGNITIDPKAIKIPVALIAADNDKITPIESVTPLHNQLKNSTMIIVKGGHINYLISEKLTAFISEYKNWHSSIAEHI